MRLCSPLFLLPVAGLGARGCPSPNNLEGVCTGPSKGLGFFGFAAQIPSIAGTRTLFLHLKLLLRRANRVCRNSVTSKASFGVRPGRILSVNREIVQLSRG